jgi:hypothetical protein
MKVRKRYQNGGGVPSLRDILASSVAGRLLGLSTSEDKRIEDLATSDRVRGLQQQDLQRRQAIASQLGVDPASPLVTDPAGLPSVDPFLALTAAGDAEAIGSGVAEMAGGDLLTGGANVALGAASAFIPGTLPKIKNIRGVEVTKRDPSKRRIADMSVEDDLGIGKNLGAIDKSGMSVEGEDMFEPFISADAARVADNKERLKRLKGMENPNDGQRLEIERLEAQNEQLPQQLRDASAEEVRRTMALATNEMLDAVPIGGKVGSSSLSTDSYAIILKKWAKGQLSAKKFDAGGGENHGLLNRMGQKYKNSPEVEEWHRSRYDGNEEIVGYDDFGGSFNSMYAPAQQMEFEEFVQVDPAAKKAFQAGKKRQAENLYEKYTIQADNDLGISYFGTTASEARLSREEAQKLVNKFNMRMRELAQERPMKQERMLKRRDNQAKAKLSGDLGIPPAKVIEDYLNPGYYIIEYPQIPFHRNFEYGGKFKIKKKRRPGMQVKR